MMKHELAVPVIACMIASVGLAVLAQDAPKPGPEHEKMGYFVGKWKMEGEVMENPMMPAGKMSGDDECSWFEGGFALVCHSDGKGPMGKMKGLGIMAYSQEDQAYTYYGLDNSGMAMSSVAKGKVEGDTWTYTDESSMGGVPMKTRWMMKQLSPTSYSFQWDMEGEDGTWHTIMRGKSTKKS